MFNYILSVSVAFIVFGTIHNVLLNVNKWWYNEFKDSSLGWMIVGIFSAVWFISVPALLLLGLMYLLKLLTDGIANFVLSKINNRKLKKEKGDV